MYYIRWAGHELHSKSSNHQGQHNLSSSPELFHHLFGWISVKNVYVYAICKRTTAVQLTWDNHMIFKYPFSILDMQFDSQQPASET